METLRTGFASLRSPARIAPVVAATHPLERLADAQRQFANKDFVGKIVVTM